MKILALAIVLCCISQALSQFNLCLPNCRNFAKNPLVCVFGASRCNIPWMRMLCPMSCKVCTPCAANDLRLGKAANSDECDLEDCVDLAPPDQCLTITTVMTNGCSLYPQSCRLSCGQCKPCPKPDPVAPCSTSCEDFNESCDHWKSQGYCNKTSQFYSYTSQECPRSCGVCELCPTPPPLNTALPPTELVCNQDCENKNENCEFWKKEGYCNRTEEFPQIIEECSLSCGSCKLCPTEEPTPPPCSLDCEDSNENCDFWEEQGYCDEDSRFPRVREECHKSCGICTVCPEEENRSAGLPPTREEVEGQKSTALPPTREEAEAGKSTALPPRRNES